MKVKVVENLCIGCGACMALVPDEFTMEDDGISKAINPVVEDEELKNDVITARDNCPTSAISVEE